MEQLLAGVQSRAGLLGRSAGKCSLGRNERPQRVDSDCITSKRLRIVDGRVLGGHENFKQLAVVRPSNNGMADARGLHPARSW